MTDIAETYRHVAAGFTRRLQGIAPDDEQWASPSPCAGWSARDVVRHLVEAHGIFFGLIEHDPGLLGSADDDPAAAWDSARAAMQSALDDPAIAEREFDGMSGRGPWNKAVDRFLTGDILVHTWDVSRGLGIEETLDAGEVHRRLAATTDLDPAIEQRMRQPDVYGPAVDVPADASEQDQLLAFTGRDPR